MDKLVTMTNHVEPSLWVVWTEKHACVHDSGAWAGSGMYMAEYSTGITHRLPCRRQLYVAPYSHPRVDRGVGWQKHQNITVSTVSVEITRLWAMTPALPIVQSCDSTLSGAAPAHSSDQ
ncbi:hypothetical protein M404DRAFT_552616 [Pisolithus tinctorius Marx 270]|uniref:Uncharacterized protein n=1 Tax=Pisolithus tinctorius Marx 270 TaxID=870435 RepID=A0A0C3PAA0_PISTI|nr:hypothetical protein M404DRAFT_552616 [Pisolithus tinctorius Marx 270]